MKNKKQPYTPVSESILQLLLSKQFSEIKHPSFLEPIFVGMIGKLVICSEYTRCADPVYTRTILKNHCNDGIRYLVNKAQVKPSGDIRQSGLGVTTYQDQFLVTTIRVGASESNFTHIYTPDGVLTVGGVSIAKFAGFCCLHNMSDKDVNRLATKNNYKPRKKRVHKPKGER